MTADSLVSVIIPTYNRATKCVAAVESVLNQTHKSVEVIVIDDGSTDETENVVSNLDSRVRYLRQENAGVTVARNTGLNALTGDYVAFLDSDDSWMPWKLEAQLAVLRRFPDVEMIWSDMTAVDEYGNHLHTRYLRKMYSAYALFDTEKVFGQPVSLSEIWGECPAGLEEESVYCADIFSSMFLGNLVHTSTVLMTRKRQGQIGFFDESLIRTGEDYDFHFRACSFGPVAILDTPSIYYQVGASDQLTRPELSKWMAANNLKTIRKTWREDSQRITLPRRMVCERWAKAYFWVAMEEFWDDPRLARTDIWRSIKWWPWQPVAWSYYLLTLVPLNWSRRLRRLKQKMSV